MNKAQLIIFGGIGLVVLFALGLLTGVIPGLKEQPPAPFTLEVWGSPEEEEIWKTITADYQKTVKTADIKFAAKEPTSYEADFVNALASGKGPDVFFLKDVWLERHRDKISPLKAGELEYEAGNARLIFADSVANAITDENGSLLGMPLAFDTLALFYNRDYLNAANIPEPPKTWADLIEAAKRLTITNDAGAIDRAGIALGTAANVEHAADILLALIYQGGGEIIDPETRTSKIRNPATESALLFYTAFSDPVKKTYSWNGFFPNSIEAFARGEAAMMVGYAEGVKTIARLNPQLNFDVAQLPQTDPKKPQVNLGRFGVFAVSRLSKERENAWKFLLWLEEKPQQKAYIDALGLPPARRDLVNGKPPRQYLAPFYNAVLSAKTAPLEIGDSLAGIFDAMIQSVIEKKFNTNQAIRRAQDELNRILIEKTNR